MKTELFGPQGFELVTEMAHDFRSPLSSILMLTESLLDGGPGALNVEQSRYLRIVYGAALGLAATTWDVMELAQHEGHLSGETPQPFLTTDVIRQVCEKLEPLSPECRRDVQGETAGDGERLGLPLAIGSVLMALAVRAVRLGDASTVRISAQPVVDDPDRVCFTVRDGETIHGDASLFEPFAPTDAPKPNDFSPPGLGLFVCRKMLREMGSGIDIAPAATGGTTFSFTLYLPRSPAM